MQEQQTEHKETLDKTEARQGQRGFSTRVLLISLPLIILAFIAIYIFAEVNDSETPTAGNVPSLESSETTVTE